MKVFATLLAMLLATGMNNVAIADTDQPLVTVGYDKNLDEGLLISKNKVVTGAVTVGAAVIGALGGMALTKRIMKGLAKEIESAEDMYITIDLNPIFDGMFDRLRKKWGQGSKVTEVTKESEITAFNERLDDVKRLTKKFAENPDDEQAIKEAIDAAERIDAMIKEAGSDELARRLAVFSIEMTTDVETDTLLKNLQEASTSAARQEAKEAIEEAIEEFSKELAQLRAGDYDDMAKEVVESNLPNPRKTYDNFETYVAAQKNATGAKPEAELRELWDNYDEIFATRVEELSKNLANDVMETFERSLNKLRSALQ